MYKDFKEAQESTRKDFSDGLASHISEVSMVVFKKLHKDAIIPNRAHDTDAGCDLYSVDDVIIEAHKQKLVKTGIAWKAIGQEMQIRPRSGLAFKHSVTVMNSPGTIDESYRNDIGVILINHSNENYQVTKGDRIAQAVFQQVHRPMIFEVETLDDTERGEGGFGSTGK